MSEFDRQLQQAQSRHLVSYIITGVAVLVIAIVVWLWLAVLKSYTFIVSPDELAEQWQLQTISGIAWQSGNKLYSLSPQVVIEISAPRYITQTLDIDPNSPVNITVVLKPKPAHISATTDKSLQDVRWTIDNKPVAISSNLDHSLPSGEYLLAAQHPYFQAAEKRLVLEKGQQLDVVLAMEALVGEVNIQSTPSGADIVMDGEKIGVTPLSIERLGGEYQVQVQLQDHHDVEDSIQISQGNLTQSRHYQLQLKPARLQIALQPEGGRLLVEGQQQTVSNGVASVEISANKTVSVLYQKPGFLDFQTKVQLGPQQQRDLAIQLSAESGEVLVTTSPQGEVLINGQSAGVGPVTRVLPGVKTKIEVRKAGFRSVLKTIVPNSQHQTVIDEPLLTEFEARRRDGIVSQADKLGIKLRRFRGQSLLMGSKNNEPDRRRNEFPVQVTFDRVFWVSETEITEAQFAAFSKKSSNSKLPVSNVSWLQAAAFCNWLSIQDGLPVFYRINKGRLSGIDRQSNGYRLPTEAEWEWLARKTKRATETRYPWGNQSKLGQKLGNIADKSRNGLQSLIFSDYQDPYKERGPVASFAPDRNGLYDLVGNVSEWVHDSYTNTPPDTQTIYSNYLGSSRGVGHVVKGGSYLTGRLTELRGAYRDASSKPEPHIGFRIARYDQRDNEQ